MENYAGFWMRVGAYLIDSIILFMAQMVIGAVLGVGLLAANDSSAVTSTLELIANLIGLLIGLSYFAGMQSSSWQATIGKKALGLVVTDMHGHRISLPRAIGRYFAKFLSALLLLIGFIMVAFTDKKQGLHDMLAGTLVLRGQPGMVAVDADVFS